MTLVIFTEFLNQGKGGDQLLFCFSSGIISCAIASGSSGVAPRLWQINDSKRLLNVRAQVLSLAVIYLSETLLRHAPAKFDALPSQFGVPLSGHY
jgi:hypothetical protein